MYAGAVAVPLIVGGALINAGQFDAADLHHLVVADLFVAGIASVIQSIGLWRFGAKLPLMQGVSFVAVALSGRVVRKETAAIAAREGTTGTEVAA